MVHYDFVGKNPFSESLKDHHLTSSVFSDEGCLNSHMKRLCAQQFRAGRR